MIKEVNSKRGIHLVEVLPGGAIGKIQWVERLERGIVPLPECRTITLNGKGSDASVSQEFMVQLIRGDDEILVSVFCEGLKEAIALVEAKSHTASELRNGYRVWASWEVIDDEF